ncbi:hypothetical protein Tco_0531123 [Tanacetum coccineum]
MDDPNITKDEYIKLEEEKARRHAILYNDALTSEVALSCEPTVSIRRILGNLLNESDDVGGVFYGILCVL